MTEQSTEEQAPDEAVEEREVPFMGRTFHAKYPQPEQILVWKRTLDRLAGADMATWNGQQVLAALDRIRKIIDSLLSPQDIDWIDDQMLVNKFTLKDAQALMMEIITAFKDPSNRAERRAAAKAAPAPAARRRAPAKKTATKTTPRKAAR